MKEKDRGDISPISHRDPLEQMGHDDCRLYAKFFNEAPDAIVVVDSSGVIRLVNQQVEGFFGYAPAELIGRSVEMLIPERYRERHRYYRDGYFSDPRLRKMGVGLELYGRNRDGSERSVDIMLSPMETDEGLWAFAVIRDITAQRRNEAQIKALNLDLQKHVEQLAASNKELEAFSYSVSHDLRAPLRALDGISAALLEDYGKSLDATAHNYLARIRSAAQAMGELIDHLLTLSRLSRLELRMSAVDLSAMARRIVGELTAQEPGRRVDVRIRDGMTVSGDPHLLEIAVTNLLNNAWKFTSKTATARIIFDYREEPDGERTYFISDNGAGFNNEYVANLFKPFQRLHAAGDFPGTGVGLATVQRVITRHGGRIYAEGEEGQGATFYFTIGQPEPQP